MIDAIASPWLPYAVLVSITAFARMRCGSWFAPAAFVGLVWSFFTGASLLVVDYPVPDRGMWMLVLLIVAVQLGAIVAHQLQPEGPSGNRVSDEVFDSLIAPCRRYALLCTAIALAGCAYFLFTSLEEFDLPFTPLSVLEVGAKWTLQRYDDILEPWSVRLLVTWFHPACLLGGILFTCSRRRIDRAIALTTLAPALFYGILTGARAVVLLGLTCWIGGYVAALCILSPALAMFTRGRVSLLLLTAAAMLGLFAGVDAIRDTSWSEDVVLDLHEQKLSNYIFGPPAAFASWYAHPDASEITWGTTTFAGPSDLLRIKQRTVGTYGAKLNLLGTESTNVYTFLRGLIEDFTEFGALIISAGVGGLAGWIYGRRYRNPRSRVFWLSMFFSVMLFSPLVSLFSFNGAVLAWVVGWFVLRKKRPSPATFALPFLAGPEAIR
ncbi:MAG: O-antigen polymerase [Candidatus Sulfotelmatobacter sp.]